VSENWWASAPLAPQAAPPSANWWEAAPLAPQGAKGREWADVPMEALKNIPKSAVGFAQSIVHPIIHPIDTAKSLVSLADALGSKISGTGNYVMEGTPEPAPEAVAAKAAREAPADAVGAFFKDRYGSVEGIKKTLATDPVGAAADLATVLTGGAGLTARAPMVSGTLAKIASAIDPISIAGAGAKGIFKVAEPVVSNALGVATGTGAGAIRGGAEAGIKGDRAFLENMRGNVAASDVVDTAKGALGQMREERGAAYNQGMAGVKADPTVLDFTPIDRAFGGAQQIGTYEGKVTNRSAGKAQAEIGALIDEWRSADPAKFHTPAGLDALKKSIGDVKDNLEFGSPARTFADQVYNAVRGEITAQAPVYGKTMEGYSNASKELDEIKRSLSLGDKASQDTATRKLSSVMRNNVNTNYGQRETLMRRLAEYEPSLPAAIAGQQMSSATPRGLAQFGAGGTMGAAAVMANPAILAGLLLQSPRLVGEAAYAGGRVASGVSKAGEAIGKAELPAFQIGQMTIEDRDRVLARLLNSSAQRGPRKAG